MKQIREIASMALFFLSIIGGLAFLISLNEEKPHRVIIDGKEYTRMTEWNGDHYQIILIPVKDTLK